MAKNAKKKKRDSLKKNTEPMSLNINNINCSEEQFKLGMKKEGEDIRYSGHNGSFYI